MMMCAQIKKTHVCNTYYIILPCDSMIFVMYCMYLHVVPAMINLTYTQTTWCTTPKGSTSGLAVLSWKGCIQLVDLEARVASGRIKWLSHVWSATCM